MDAWGKNTLSPGSPKVLAEGQSCQESLFARSVLLSLLVPGHPCIWHLSWCSSSIQSKTILPYREPTSLTTRNENTPHLWLLAGTRDIVRHWVTTCFFKTRGSVRVRKQRRATSYLTTWNPWSSNTTPHPSHDFDDGLPIRISIFRVKFLVYALSISILKEDCKPRPTLILTSGFT